MFYTLVSRGQISISNTPYLHVFARDQTHTERDRPTWELNPKPSTCKKTILPTKPLYHPRLESIYFGTGIVQLALVTYFSMLGYGTRVDLQNV